MKRVLPLLLLAGMLGCRESVVTLEVAIPNALGELGPAAGVTIIALPYDRDSLSVSMENAAPTPRPHTAELDSLFQRFREPFAQSTRIAVLVEQVRGALRIVETDTAWAAILADSMAVLQDRHVVASQRLSEVREQVGPRIDSLQAEVRAWERVAFRDWAETTRSLTSGRLMVGIIDTTKQDGTARLYLPPGKRHWWIHARSFNSADPHSEWYWNLPVTGPTMILDTSTGRLRPRY